MGELMLNLFAISLKDVQKRTENVDTDIDTSGWRPYYTFKDSLQEKYSKNEDIQGNSLLQLQFMWRKSVVNWFMIRENYLALTVIVLYHKWGKLNFSILMKPY